MLKLRYLKLSSDEISKLENMLDKCLSCDKVLKYDVFGIFRLFKLSKAFVLNTVFVVFTSSRLQEVILQKKKKFITAMQVVKKYNIPYSTFSLYSNLGFFGAGTRNGNKRLYGAAMIGARMKKIIRFKKAGYPLRMIRQRIRG